MKRERAAIYCRLSEEDKGKGSAENDSNSIQNQRALLTEYAHSHGWEIYEIYCLQAHAARRRGETV